MDRNISIIEDADGNKVVQINSLKFRGKRKINWDEVEGYLRQFVGEKYVVHSTGDVIHIGSDLPEEYAHSNYTHILKGTTAKAKANAAQGIPEMLETAVDKNFEENRKEKHNSNAKLGWYRYDSRFSLPVYGEKNEVERYNVFRASMLVRHAKDGKMYLYDIMNIKKETR